MKNRIYYLDVLRCLACLMVVAMHSPVPDGGLPGWVVVPISLATAPCIGLFFMVSGALLLPTKENGLHFIRRRFGKIAGPVIVWTAISIVLEANNNGFPPMPELVSAVLSIPFSNQGHGILWFMYAMAGLYLLAPVISPWLEKASKREIQFYLAIWAVTLCFPFLKMFLKVDEGNGGMFYYLSGYLGYFVLGYYLRRFGNGRSLWAFLWLPVPFAALGLCKIFSDSIDLGSHFWYLSIFSAVSCWAWFTIARNASARIDALRPKALALLVNLSNLSFGIYLVHIFVMRDFMWNVLNIGKLGWASIFVSFFGTVILSYGLVRLISHIPGAEYIIGYKARR